MRVLVVDDVRSSRLALRLLLEADGHEVIEAADGIEAIAAFRDHRPDLIVMDVNMPRLDGFAATRVIKERSADRFVPILLVTALGEEHVSRSIDCGADDYIQRPLRPQILRARLASWQRMRDLLGEVQRQRDTLREHEAMQEAEREAARRIFARVVGDRCPPRVQAVGSAAAVFNGDVILSGETTDERLRVLVGDFTGHGLAAAMGTLPVADAFRDANVNAFSLEETVLAIDKRLRVFLPPGMFFAAGLVELGADGSARIVNLGLPPILILGETSVREISSSGPPLGIPIGVRDVVCQAARIGADDAIVVCTDGVIEARDAAGAELGLGRVVQALHGCPPAGMASRLTALVRDHQSGRAQADDISFAIVSPGLTGGRKETDLNERTVWRLDAHALRAPDPLAPVEAAVAAAPWATDLAPTIVTIVAELFANSLDYGILRLSSADKRDPATYERFAMAREEALARITDAEIVIELVPRDDGVQIIVEDSGDGFDVDESLRRARAELEEGRSAVSGRGLVLLSAVADELRWENGGRRAIALVRRARSTSPSSARARTDELVAHAAIAAFDASDRALLVEDAARRIVRVNRAFCALFRVEQAPAALCGLSCASALEACMSQFQDGAAFLSEVEATIQARVPVTGATVRFADGRICLRDYAPLPGGGHLWTYAAGGEEAARGQAMEEHFEGVVSQLSAAATALGLVASEPSPGLAQVAAHAADEARRLLELSVDVARARRRRMLDLAPTTVQVDALSTWLRAGLVVDVAVPGRALSLPVNAIARAIDAVVPPVGARVRIAWDEEVSGLEIDVSTDVARDPPIFTSLRTELLSRIAASMGGRVLRAGDDGYTFIAPARILLTSEPMTAPGGP